MSSQHSNKMDSNNVEEMESFVKRLSKNESENESCCDKIKNHQRLIIIIALIIRHLHLCVNSQLLGSSFSNKRDFRRC